ncbi:DNA-binding protein [Pseudomonas aeruginosa]
MPDEVAQRVRELIKLVGVKRLSQLSPVKYDRWSNIHRGLVRIGSFEIGVLCKIFPEYALWIVTGNTQPECGHRNPISDAISQASHESDTEPPPTE